MTSGWAAGLLSEASGAYWPLATYPCPFREPFPSVDGGAHQLLTQAGIRREEGGGGEGGLEPKNLCAKNGPNQFFLL